MKVSFDGSHYRLHLGPSTGPKTADPHIRLSIPEA